MCLCFSPFLSFTARAFMYENDRGSPSASNHTPGSFYCSTTRLYVRFFRFVSFCVLSVSTIQSGPRRLLDASARHIHAPQQATPRSVVAAEVGPHHSPFVIITTNMSNADEDPQHAIPSTTNNPYILTYSAWNSHSLGRQRRRRKRFVLDCFN